MPLLSCSSLCPLQQPLPFELLPLPFELLHWPFELLPLLPFQLHHWLLPGVVLCASRPFYQ